MPEATDFSPEDKLTLESLIVQIYVKILESPENPHLPGSRQVQFFNEEHPQLVARFKEIGQEISDMRAPNEAGLTREQVEELAKLRKERVTLLEGLINDKFDGSLSKFKDWWNALPPLENRGEVHTSTHRDQLI